MTIQQFWKKVRCKLLKLRLQPIRVFCFHQVSDVFQPEKCFNCDWTNIDQFKRVILSLQKHYVFISLEEAYRHICNDRIRRQNYAVLTSDDGYYSLLNILPWLELKRIPITLFLNSHYLDGKHYIADLYCQAKKVKPAIDEETFVKNLYLTKEDLFQMNFDWVSLGLHGHEHVPVVGMSEEEFEAQLNDSLACFKGMKGYVSFYAYTFGLHTKSTDEKLRKWGIVPVLIDGGCNINDPSVIHRECIDKWEV